MFPESGFATADTGFMMKSDKVMARSDVAISSFIMICFFCCIWATGVMWLRGGMELK
jgi:hypothetical protein